MLSSFVALSGSESWLIICTSPIMFLLQVMRKQRWSQMDGMKLRYRFKGRGGGKITVWWDHPQKYRNSYPYHQFGLGAVELVHDLKALDADALARVSLLIFLSDA